MNYIGNLTGRYFLISDIISVKQWFGNEPKNNTSDYDLINEDLIELDETNLLNLEKKDFRYLVHCSLSTKLELFHFKNSFIICDGLFFNEKIPSINHLDFKIIEDLNFFINVKNNGIVIADASINLSNKLHLDQSEIIINEEYCFLPVNNGLYKTKIVRTTFYIEDEEITLNGILFEP